MKNYKIKFKNGYTVEINDSENKSKKEIFNEAYKAMNIAKKYNDSSFSITPKSNMISHVSKIKEAIKKGEVVDPKQLDYEIRNIEMDMEADLNHDKWYKKFHPTALRNIINDYQKLIDEVAKAKDPKYQDKVKELSDKLAQIKEIFKITDEVEDVKIEDVPIAEPTMSYSLKPDPYFSADNIAKAAQWLESRDPEKKAGAKKILLNEYTALKENMENDYNNAEEFISEFNKEQLKEFMHLYLDYMNVYLAAGLNSEYQTLKDLYNKLYFDAFHISRPEGVPTVQGSRSVIALKNRR